VTASATSIRYARKSAGLRHEVTPDNTERPAEAAGPPAPAAQPPAAAPPAAGAGKALAPPPRDEFDPMGWEVPLICKDCGKEFKVPYRHFQIGVVFHCLHCHGSFVPKLNIYRAVRDAFEMFYARRKRERDEFIRSGGDESAFRLEQERRLAEFHKRVDALAHAMRPAGKMVKPKGLAAMFS
jgi:hypothetical protein